MEKKTKINIMEHILVPKHVKLTEEEKNKFLKESNYNLEDLPLILSSDPAIKELESKENDLIKIERKSSTAGISYFYRRVING